MKFNLMFLSDIAKEAMTAILQTAKNERFLGFRLDTSTAIQDYEFCFKEDTIFLSFDSVFFNKKRCNVIIYATLPFVEQPKIMEIPF